MITYKLDTNGILQVVFTGSIGYKDIAEWLVVFSNLPDLPPRINLLYDMMNANLMLDMVKLIQVTKKTEEATKKFEKVRTAFVLTESGLSTYSVLFSFLDVSGRTTRKVFTDLNKATEWLLKEDF